jgi:electron transfer flavoprotein alpha subunit
MTTDSISGSSGGKYRNLYVVVEHMNGKIVPVSLEMIGEARRLMDKFNSRYHEAEQVVAILLGYNIEDLCNELVSSGADVVVYSNF